MLLRLEAAPVLTRLSYTCFEIGLGLGLLAATMRLVVRIVVVFRTPQPFSGSDHGAGVESAMRGG